MPVKLSNTTVSKITSLPESTDAALITESYQYMKNNVHQKAHTNNRLKINMALRDFLAQTLPFMLRRSERVSFVGINGTFDLFDS